MNCELSIKKSTALPGQSQKVFQPSSYNVGPFILVQKPTNHPLQIGM